MTKGFAAVVVASFCVVYALCGIANAQSVNAAPAPSGTQIAQDEAIEQIMASARPAAGTGAAPISVVREAALREAAEAMGARRGLRDKSCAINAEIERQKGSLELRYRFSDLLMGRGVLPPVISEAKDSVALDTTVMRVASRVYHLDEQARIVDVAPTWRDWLYVGLPIGDCSRPYESTVDLPDQLRPRDALEVEYFRSVVARAYVMGRQQGTEIFSHNLARLERSYLGMRRYFDLFARGMVSAPVVVASTDIVKRDDPNTLIVGNTLIRITVPVDFVEAHQKWKPLAQ